MAFNKLKNDRYTDITMRVFNGTGRVLELASISGKLRFSAPNNKDPNYMGYLPPLSVRSDTSKVCPPFSEWLLIFAQPIGGEEADKILNIIESGISLHLQLSDLNIQIANHANREEVERLPLWAGVSYCKDFGFGRIISAVMNVRM